MTNDRGKGMNDDLISRQTVLDIIDKWYPQKTPRMIKMISELPSVNPQEPCGDAISLEAFKQVMWERDIAIGQLKELGYGFGQKIEPSGDLISRQAVIDIIHLFFTEEVDKIPTKKTEDGEVYIIRKCQPLFEMNKAICKRIKALPSASPTQNCVGNALDCISRHMVLNLIRGCNNALEEPRIFNCHNAGVKFEQYVTELPPVTPQEPCGDLISRQAVLDALHNSFTDGFNSDKWWNSTHVLWAINNAPSVNPQEPKTGHWEQYGYPWDDKFKCSECGKEQPKILCGERIIGHWSDYCPNCGCRMVEPQESEGKDADSN